MACSALRGHGDRSARSALGIQEDSDFAHLIPCEWPQIHGAGVLLDLVRILEAWDGDGAVTATPNPDQRPLKLSFLKKRDGR
jgi:hypothetical protein